MSTVQACGGGVGVWGFLGPLILINHCLDAAASLSIVADHVHPQLMATIYHLLMATSCTIMNQITKQESSHTGFMNMTCEFSELQWPPQSPDMNQI